MKNIVKKVGFLTSGGNTTRMNVVKGKSKIVRNKKIFKSDFKKAIVTLKKGQNIDLSTGI